jgi:hypothetical protein
MKKRAIAIGLVLLLVLVATAAAIRKGERIELRAGNLVLAGRGGFAPEALPKYRNAPIILHGAGHISTVNGELPPILERIEAEFDRHGAIDTTGLGVCTTRKLAATTVAEARRVCGDAIVGKGVGHGVIKFPEQSPIPVSSPLTLFNGPKICHSRSRRLRGRELIDQPHARTRSGGHAAFIQNQRSSDPQSQSDSSWGSLDRPFVHDRGELRARAGACNPSVIGHGYLAVPVPTTYIVPVVIEKINKGVYGYRINVKIPPIAGGYGIPISAKGKVGRKWTFRGQKLSYLSARCETGHLQARGKFSFNDGTLLSGTILKPCTVRR